MKHSAIIVLGNLMDAAGRLNRESASRLDLAIKAYHDLQAPCLVTCGWAYRDDSEIVIADAMRKYAIEIGNVPASSVITEPSSRDTVGDAVFTKRNLFNKLGWRSLLIVTSDYHVPRTKRIFDFIFGTPESMFVIGATTDHPQERAQAESQSLSAFQETFRGIEAGDDAAIFRRLSEAHPFYNGTVYPQILETEGNAVALTGAGHK